MRSRFFALPAEKPLQDAPSQDAVALPSALVDRIRELKSQQSQAKANKQVTQTNADKYLAYSQRIISRYDQDTSGSLTQPEWAKMLKDPSPADSNKDGEITVEEYRDYLMKKTSAR